MPVTFSAQKVIKMNSWDGFTLWRPFSKVSVVFGEPILIPRKLTPDQLEESRVMVEHRMNALQEEADEVFRS